jgi:hypothetical protein
MTQTAFRAIPTISRKRRIIEIAFGIVLPPICLAYDPGLFHRGFISAIAAEIQVFAYLSIFVGMLALVISFRLNSVSERYILLIAAILIIGAIFAFIIWIVILPIWTFGLLVWGAGIIGFTPFITAYIYWRNGREAMLPLGLSMRSRRLAKIFVIAIFIVFGFPVLTQIAVNYKTYQTINEIVVGSDMNEILQTVKEIQTGFWCLDYCQGEMARLYLDNLVNSEQRRQLLAMAYEGRTGRKIYSHFPKLFD